MTSKGGLVYQIKQERKNGIRQTVAYLTNRTISCNFLGNGHELTIEEKQALMKTVADRGTLQRVRDGGSLMQVEDL